MLRIVAGSALSDISGKMTSEMVKRATGEIDRKFIIIVPEQYTLQTQKRVAALHPFHACMNIDVVSFERLAIVILTKMGKNRNEILDDVGKSLLLRTVLDDCEKELKVYGSKVRMQGFSDELKSLITEFKLYGIDDNTLFLMQEEAAARDRLLYEKLGDIRLIFRNFNEEIEDKFTTPEEILDVLSRCLADSDFFACSSVYLDGFTGFSPVQYRLIGKMLCAASDVNVALTVPAEKICENFKEYDLFALPNETILKLKKAAEEAKEEVVIDAQGEAEAKGKGRQTPGEAAQLSLKPDEDYRAAASREKAQKEATVREGIVEKMPAAPGRDVHIISCANPRREVSCCAEKILKIVREGNSRFRDIAVLAADMESYGSLIASEFSKAGISAFIDRRNALAGNILVRFITSALEAAERSMNYDKMFAFLKTGLCFINPDETALLENYCLEFNIRGRARWEAPFEANRESRGEPVWNLDALNDIRSRAQAGINRFCGRVRPGKKSPAALFCKALLKLLEDYHVREQIEGMAGAFRDRGQLSSAAEYAQIYGKVTELIDKIEMIMGARTVNISEFALIMESGMSEISIAVIPPSVDTLTVGDIMRTRAGSVSHLFILGMNDGLIPSAGSSSVLFTQRERSALREKFEIAPTALENMYTQRYYLYILFNKPKNALYLTYSERAEDGAELKPSCLIGDTELLSEDSKAGEEGGREGEALWRSRALELVSAGIRKLCSGEEDLDYALLCYFALEEPALIRKLAAGAAYTNKQTPLDGRVALDLYGEVLKGSVSRFETYYECPYRHFLNYGIGLEKRREFEIKAADLGTIYHDALERYSRMIGDEGYTFRNISDEDSRRIIELCADEAMANTDVDVLGANSRGEFLKDRIRDIARKTTDVLRDQVKAGLFEPSEFEFTFESKRADNIRFRGKIDRVDIYDGGDIFVKIIDYKSGSKKFSVKDIYSGIQLQLAAYMASAVSETKKKNPGRNVRPGGVFYYLINDKYTKPDDAEEKNRMSGLALDEEKVIRAMDRSLADGEDASSTIIPVSVKNGKITYASATASEREFENLMKFAGRRLDTAGENIMMGDISVLPYKDGAGHTGCGFCDYRDICRFEAGEFGADYRECAVTAKEAKEAVYGGSEAGDIGVTGGEEATGSAEPDVREGKTGAAETGARSEESGEEAVGSAAADVREGKTGAAETGARGEGG